MVSIIKFLGFFQLLCLFTMSEQIKSENWRKIWTKWVLNLELDLILIRFLTEKLRKFRLLYDLLCKFWFHQKTICCYRHQISWLISRKFMKIFWILLNFTNFSGFVYKSTLTLNFSTFLLSFFKRHFLPKIHRKCE